MLRTSSKGIGMFLAFVIFSFFFIVSTILFVYFFRFHINMYIISNAEKSKISSLPLILFTVTHTDENYNYIIARNIGISPTEYYDIGSYTSAQQCYNIEIDSGGYNFCEVQREGDGIPYCPRSTYRLKYPLPIVSTGGKIIEDFTLSIHKTGEPGVPLACI